MMAGQQVSREERYRRPARAAFRSMQRGAYALEFGLVFTLVLAVVYGLVVAGILFTSSQVLLLAAEDGARAALRDAPDLPARLDEAERVALARAQPFAASVQVVPVCLAACGGPARGMAACFEVVVRAPSPIPLVPGLSAWVDDEVTGSARALLDGFDAEPAAAGGCA